MPSPFLPDDERFDRLDELAPGIFPEGVTVMRFGEILERLRELAEPAAEWIDEDIVDRWMISETAPFPLGGGRYVDWDGLLADRVFTHRLTAREIEQDRVREDPDLSLVMADAIGPRPLVGGGELWDDAEMGDIDQHGQQTDPEQLVSWLYGPDGWLEDYSPGDVLAVALRGEQAELAPDVPAASEERIQATVGALADAHRTQRELGEGPAAVMVLLLEALAADPGAFAATHPPLGDLLARAGLRYELDWVLAEDEEAPEPQPGLYDRLRDRGFDEEQALPATRLFAGLEAAVRLGVDGLEASPWDDEHLAELAEAMTVPPAFELGLEEILTTDGADALPAVEALADAVEEGLEQGALALADRGASDRLSARTHYARAVVAEWEDDPEAQERELRLATGDADMQAALLDLAWLAEVRSDPVKARQHLRAAGVARDDEQMQVLAEWSQPGPAAAGRNDPCPCGSGRKHKVCCGRMNGWPLRARLVWVSQKLHEWLARPPQLDKLFAAAGQRMTPGIDPDEAFEQALDDPLLHTLAIFDGETVPAFADIYAPLLPADELAALRDLEPARPAVYEVLEVDLGERLLLLDLIGGERVEVTERSGSRSLRENTIVLAVVGEVELPAGEPGTREPMLFGALRPVASHERSSLVELMGGDWQVEDLYRWLGRAEAPPRMQTTEGQDMVFCEAELDVAGLDRQAVVGALDGVEALEREDGGDSAQAALHVGRGAVGASGRDVEAGDDAAARWVELVPEPPDGGRWIRGTVRLTGDTLVVETNAEERFVRLLGLVREVVPEAETVAESGRSWEQVQAEEPAAGDAGLLDLDDLDADVREQVEAELDKQMREAERNWVDEEIPALGGLTPREALDDPTRRDDLLRLLDEFEALEEPGGIMMRASRLRELLGLE